MTFKSLLIFSWVGLILGYYCGGPIVYPPSVFSSPSFTPITMCPFNQSVTIHQPTNVVQQCLFPPQATRIEFTLCGGGGGGAGGITTDGQAGFYIAGGGGGEVCIFANIVLQPEFLGKISYFVGSGGHSGSPFSDQNNDGTLGELSILNFGNNKIDEFVAYGGAGGNQGDDVVCGCGAGGYGDGNEGGSGISHQGNIAQGGCGSFHSCFSGGVCSTVSVFDGSSTLCSGPGGGTTIYQNSYE